jgi:hypothetical protein
MNHVNNLFNLPTGQLNTFWSISSAQGAASLSSRMVLGLKMPNSCTGRLIGQLHCRGATHTWAFGNLRENGPTKILCSYANVGRTMYSTGASSSFSSCRPPTHETIPTRIRFTTKFTTYRRGSPRTQPRVCIAIVNCLAPEKHLDAFSRWRNGGMNPQSAGLELDHSHARVGRHVAEPERLLLLKCPYPPFLYLQTVTSSQA